MIRNDTLHRALEHGTNRKAQRCCCLTQLTLVGPGNATYKRHRQVATVVRSNMGREELGEVIHHKCTQAWGIEMFVNKRRKRCQKTVGLGLTIDTLDDVSQRKTCLSFEINFQFF